jgi:hypothetical protein
VAGLGSISADGTADFSGASPRSSQYKPENGAAVNLFAGRHFSDWVSVQGNYVWHRNPVKLISIAGESFYEQQRASSQQGAIADLMVYFRPRSSRLRPYLSIGTGAIRLNSTAESLAGRPGALPIPADRFSSVKPVVRFLVGIDIAVGRGWALRYTFSETIRGNDFSARLTPAAPRGLASFQNLVGITRTF